MKSDAAAQAVLATNAAPAINSGPFFDIWVITNECIVCALHYKLSLSILANPDMGPH
jgi:hypothetical protein